MTEPLSCPFCGNPGDKDPRHSFHLLGSVFCHVQCGECSAMGPAVRPATNEHQAISAWNRRAPAQPEPPLSMSMFASRADYGAAVAVQMALQTPGCERLKDWAEIGPVQRAALELFVDVLRSAQPEPAAPTPDTFMGEPVLTRWKPLNRDDSRLALHQSMHNRSFGNPSDDKLMLEWLWENGYALCKRVPDEAAPTPQQQALDRMVENAETLGLYEAAPTEPAPGWCKHCRQYTIEEPLRAAPTVVEPLFLLHTGQIDSSGEQDDWDCEADSWQRVEEFCRQHPGVTVKLYVTPPRAALTDEQIVTEGLMMTPNKVLLSCADAFEAGVRFAERQHGIVSSAVIAADRGQG